MILAEKTAFWIAAALAVILALIPHPPHAMPAAWGDKSEHMLAFGVLTGLAAFAFPATPRGRIAERLSFLGALIEVFQSSGWINRDCDVWDWVADTLAILVVLFALWLLRLPRTRPESVD